MGSGSYRAARTHGTSAQRGGIFPARHPAVNFLQLRPHFVGLLKEENRMKAAVLHEFRTPLSLEEVAVPEVGADEVLIEVEVCGVCHSDLHVADGDWTQLAGIVKKPLILGHEIVGRVVERGAAVESVQVGDRVGVPWVQWTCRQCERCREGNENLCLKQRITGVMVVGGYAEYAKTPASHVIKIPETLPSEQAAPLLCAGVTVHRALKQAKIRAGQR